MANEFLQLTPTTRAPGFSFWSGEAKVAWTEAPAPPNLTLLAPVLSQGHKPPREGPRCRPSDVVMEDRTQIVFAQHNRSRTFDDLRCQSPELRG
ncbi:hypothetical protein GH733_001841 [Mirounga leonina]|nr:hypothetical protein GH733_001841 [Mirounga leonina]